jgi:hypothetical protein
MGLLQITLLAALVVALAATGRILYLRHLITRAHDNAASTLKEMLGDPVYSERSFDVLSMSVASEDDETRELLREIGAEQVEDDGGRELWTLSDAVAVPGEEAGTGTGGMPSA